MYIIYAQQYDESI